MVGVAELGDRDRDRLGAGGGEDGDVALGRVGVAVVQVHEEGGVGTLVREHLQGDTGQDSAAGGVVGLSRFVVDVWVVRRNGEGVSAEAVEADESRLWSRRRRWDGLRGADPAVVAESRVDGQVEEAY